MGVKKVISKVEIPVKFLETISFMGNDVLVPIDRIEYINFIYKNGYIIKIKGEGEYCWAECFGENEDKANVRYEMIKEILGAK